MFFLIYIIIIHSWFVLAPADEEPKNIKALYRRAQGALGTNDFDVAVKDCKRILELDPDNKDRLLEATQQ